MKLKMMLGKLFPSIAKNALVESTIQLNDIASQTTLPAVEIMANAYDEYIKELPSSIVTFNDFFFKKYRTNYYPTVKVGIKNCIELLDYIERSLHDKFNEDITRSALSVYHASILKLLNLIGFVSDYARRLATFQFAELDYHRRGQSPEHIKSEVEFLESHKWSYFAALNVFRRPAKELIAKLEDLPNIVLNEENYELIKNTTDIDPLEMNFIIHPLNPVIFVGTRINLYQAKKYKQAQADLQEIQARLHRLNIMRNGNKDAKLDKQVDYYTNLSVKLKSEISRMEKEYGIK